MKNVQKNKFLKIGKNAKEASRLMGQISSKLKNDILVKLLKIYLKICQL